MAWGGSITGNHGRAARIARGLVLALVFGSSLVGCKKSQIETNDSRVCDRYAYIASSFEYKPNEGEGILPISMPAPVVESYFGKLYNQEWLAAIGRASILETVEYIETKGARVYRSDPISTKSALNFKSVLAMPSDIDQEWRRADQSPGGLDCGFLAGLYLSTDTRGISSLRGRSAIVVREDAGRWTLVHEFMHHNFQTQSALGGYGDDELWNAIHRLWDAKDQLERDSSLSDKEYAQKMSVVFQRLIDVTDLMLVQYSLEEVAIETILQEKYDKGDLTYVPAGSYTNASRYISHSKKNIEEVYKGLNRTYAELYRLTLTNGLLTEWRMLARYVAMRDLRLKQLDEITAKPLLAGVGSYGARPSEWESTPPLVEDHPPCAHAQAIEADLKRIAGSMGSGR